jgi:oligogalacturonide lyase
MKLWIPVFATSLFVGAVAPQEKRDWIDPDTGHRIVRLTDAVGGSTLYFHDNPFSPEGDTLMFNTPNGIAIVDVAKIGQSDLKPEIVAKGRGGYFARRRREIDFTNGSSISAVHVDTRQVHEVTRGRGLINSDTGQFAAGERYVYAVSIEK